MYQFLLLSLLDDSVTAETRQTLGWCLVLVQLSTVTLSLVRLCSKLIVIVQVKLPRIWMRWRRSTKTETVRIRAKTVLEEIKVEQEDDGLSYDILSRDVTGQDVSNDNYHGFEVEFDKEEFKKKSN